MGRKIRVLIVEDSQDDAMLLVRQLNKNLFETEFRIVDNQSDYTHALDDQEWDLILADYNLPQFTGIEAFRIFKERNSDIPFIMVSGAIGEEVAADAMREGIHDYVMKDNADRLIPAIERELKEAQIRKEKKTAEKIIDAERLKFERLVTLSPLGLAIIQNDGVIKYINPKIIEFFGYEKDSFKTLNDFIFAIFPDRPDYQWVREYWMNTFRSVKHIHELQFPPAICRDGTSKFISFRSGMIGDDSYFLLVEDITIQRLAMRALEENQKRLWQIIQSIDDIIIEITTSDNNHYQVITVNDAFVRSTGISKESFVNNSMDTLFPDGHRIYDIIGKVIGKRQTEKFEETFETHGRLLTWDIGISPIFNERGQLLRLIMSAHDITERKKSEIQLQESETKFRLIASLASDAIWEWQVDENTLWWNEGLQTLFNYLPESIENTYQWLIKNIHQDDRPHFTEQVEQAMADKEENLNTEFRYECADGTYKVVNCKVSFYFDIKGKPVRVLGAMIDLTQRKKIEELRIQSLVEGADNERAAIARELHDSLSQNLTLASIMMQSIIEKSGKNEALDKIGEVEQIVNRVLNDTRDISHNLMPKTLADFGLRAAVENLAEHLGKGVGFGINTHFNFEDKRFSKQIEINIFRIIQESLNNVIKHAGASQVYVSLTVDAGLLTLMLEDNGKGFEMSETRVKSGVGLRNIENRAIYLNGKLTIESRPGKGTLLIVDVPV